MGVAESGPGKIVPNKTGVSNNGLTKAGLPITGARAANSGVPSRGLAKSSRVDFKTGLASTLDAPCLPGRCKGAFFMAPARFKTPNTKDK
jgi:hypothetical protein